MYNTHPIRRSNSWQYASEAGWWKVGGVDTALLGFVPRISRYQWHSQASSRYR